MNALPEVKYLMTPGPVPIPDFVFDALKTTPVHHRSPHFTVLYESLQKGLQYFFQTHNPVLIFGGSGSAAMEAVIQNLFDPGDAVVITQNGKFGNRWVKTAAGLKLEPVEISSPWGQVPHVQDIEATLLASGKKIKGIILTHSETSAGTALNLEEICFRLKRTHPDLMIITDSISSAGILPFYMDNWGIDAAVSTSQKALMNPAGAAFIALSEKARKKLKPATGFRYNALHMYLEAHQESSVPLTPPAQILSGVDACLRWYQDQGLPKIWNQIHSNARIFRKEMLKLGAILPAQSPSDALTAWGFENLNMIQIQNQLLNNYGILVEGGQDVYKGKYLRTAHFGMLKTEDMVRLTQAIAEITSSMLNP